MDDCNEPLPQHAQEGLRLFNAGDYFEAHEALELAWRAETRPIRDLYRGVLQAAVVYLHMRRGNFSGAVKVGERCLRILHGLPASCRGIRVDILRTDLARALDAWQAQGPEHVHAMDWSLLKPVVWKETGKL